MDFVLTQNCAAIQNHKNFESDEYDKYEKYGKHIQSVYHERFFNYEKNTMKQGN